MSTYESETMYEAQAFYENVANAARAGRAYKPLALLAMKAARAALTQGGEPDPEGEAEFELETPYAIHQSYSARDAAQVEALMEHLGHAGAEAESNGEAFAFLAPLLPLAMKAALPLAKSLLPKVLPKVAKVVPRLMRGFKGVVKTLRANPAGKPLVRTLPRIAQNTMKAIAKQAAAGQPVTPQQAMQTLARQTAQVIGNPRTVVQCVRRAAALDRNFHQSLQSAKPCGCQ